jgi:hypothetical protein
VPPDFLFHLAKRLSIIPDTTIAERETSLIRLNDLMAIRTCYMACCKFYDFAVIFSRRDYTPQRFMLIPCLVYSPKTTTDTMNMLFRCQGGFHRVNCLSIILYKRNSTESVLKSQSDHLSPPYPPFGEFFPVLINLRFFDQAKFRHFY